MPQDDRPLVFGLTLPPAKAVPADSRYEYWLKLADLALTAAREEQARIKEQIRPNVERYKQIRAKRRGKVA